MVSATVFFILFQKVFTAKQPVVYNHKQMVNKIDIVKGIGD